MLLLWTLLLLETWSILEAQSRPPVTNDTALSDFLSSKKQEGVRRELEKHLLFCVVTIQDNKQQISLVSNYADLIFCLKNRRVSDHWNDLFHQTKHGQNKYPYPIKGIISVEVSRNDDEEEETVYDDMDSEENVTLTCRFDYGDIDTLPSISLCLVERETYYCHIKQKLESMKTNPCMNRPEWKLIHSYKASWILAKINYLLISLTLFMIFIRSLRSKLIGVRMRQHYHVILFGFLNGCWLIWRLQETINMESKWQRHVPYICIGTNTICYVVECISLYLFTVTSMQRCHALLTPLPVSQTSTYTKHKKYKLAIASGLPVAVLCSVLHVVALYRMQDPDIIKSCTILPQHDVTGAVHSFVFLLVVKALSLCFIYLLPCFFMALSNIMMIITLQRRLNKRMRIGRRISMSGQTSLNRKFHLTSSFILFSSVFLLCCLTRPVYELVMTVNMHLDQGTGERMAVHNVVLNAIICNLTAVAFTINTVVGLNYSV